MTRRSCDLLGQSENSPHTDRPGLAKLPWLYGAKRTDFIAVRLSG